MRSDWALLLVARGLRAFGFGFAAVLVGLHLEHAGLSPVLIGLTVGLGLASASLTGLGAVVFAVRFGRRATLAVTGLLMAVTGFDLALATQPSLLVLAGVTGMLGAGNLDLGPFAPIEQTAVAEVATPQQRNLAFGRYAVWPLASRAPPTCVSSSFFMRRSAWGRPSSRHSSAGEPNPTCARLHSAPFGDARRRVCLPGWRRCSPSTRSPAALS